MAVAAIVGAWCSVTWPLPDRAAAAVAVAAVSLAVALPAGRGRQGVLIVAAAAAAAAAAARARDAALAPPLAVWFAAETRAAPDGSVPPVRLRGILAEDAARLPAGDIRLRVRVLEVEARGDDGWRRASGRVQLVVRGELAHDELDTWTRGRPIEATASLRWPAVPANPGGTPPLRQRLVRPYVLTGTVKSALLVSVEPGPWWHELPAAVRRYVRRTTTERFGGVRARSGAIVRAILIGDREGLDAATTERLIAAGTYHVIAISGGNVALVTLVVVLCLRRLLRPPRLVATAALGAVAAYGWTVEIEPSLVRAVVTAAVWLSAEAIGVRAPPMRTFSLAILVIVGADPLMVIRPGAWLSFGATLGILLCAGRLAAWVADAARAGDRGQSEGEEDATEGGGGATQGTRGGSAGDTVRTTGAPWHTRWRQLVRSAAAVGAATVAAELVLMPVGAATFSRVSLAGLPLNFIAIPAMAVVQGAGALALVPEPFGWLSGPGVLVAHVAATVLVDSARLVDWLPWLAWRVAPPPGVVLVAYYAALAVVLAGPLVGGVPRRAERGARIVLVVMVLAVATGPLTALARPPRGTLRVTFLDVGQGDAVVVQLPGRQVLLVDAGAVIEGFDAGERIVAPALWALGVSKVDWVVVTHADADHIGGVAAIVKEFGVREVWEGVPVAHAPLRAALRREVDQRDIVWRELRRGDRWYSGDAVVEVLHPPEPDWERPRVRNDDSVVIRIRHGPLDLLLTGDVGQAVEDALPLAGDAGAVRILKAAHHGSRTSTGPGLLARYRPWTAIVSAGRNNTFGHPAPEVLDRLTEADVLVLRTDRDGAVMVESRLPPSPSASSPLVTMRTWRGRRWDVAVMPGARTGEVTATVSGS